MVNNDDVVIAPSVGSAEIDAEVYAMSYVAF